MKKRYEVTIEITDTLVMNIKANSKPEAKQIAIERLKRRNPETFIHREYPSNKKMLYAEELNKPNY